MEFSTTNSKYYSEIYDYLLEKVETSSSNNYEYLLGQVQFAYALAIIEDKTRKKLCRILEKRKNIQLNS